MARTPHTWTICPGCRRKIGLQKRYDMQVPTTKQPWVLARHAVAPGSTAICAFSRQRVEEEMVKIGSAAS